MPFSNSGSDSVAGLWDKHDRYRWNKTIHDYFISKDSGLRAANACIHPYFNFIWPLRDPEDISAVIGAIFVTGAALILGMASPTTTVGTDHDQGEDQTSGNGLRMYSLPYIPARRASAPCAF